jgi:pectate lyase
MDLADKERASLAPIQGYGALTPGGAGGEVFHVTSLADNGPGTLRDGVANRDYDTEGPRLIVFDVAGTITLQNDIVVREPFLTIDGATAPAPGITIRKASISDGEFIIAGTHDIIVQHLRFWGLWELGGVHANNAATISIDGDTGPDHVAQNIVLDHVTARNATDGGPDIWGEVRDVTISWCFFFYNWHPTTVSYYPAPYQVRQRISMHHNVYAKNGERNPQIRADVRDFDYVNNIIYDWGYFGEGGGYGIRIKNNPGEPLVNGNFVNNWFLPTIRPSWSLVYGTVPGADANDGGPGISPPQGTLVTDSLMGDLYVAGNCLPPENLDQFSTVGAPLSVPGYAQVSTFPAANLAAEVLSAVGMLYRDAVEQGILDEIASLAPSPELELGAVPGDQQISSRWLVNTTVPVTTTWTLAYEGPAGDQPSPITGLSHDLRTYQLTGLTNYTVYTLTLTALQAGLPMLTDTVAALPSDVLLYLPVTK